MGKGRELVGGGAYQEEIHPHCMCPARLYVETRPSVIWMGNLVFGLVFICWDGLKPSNY